MHASKDSIWRGIYCSFAKFSGSKLGLTLLFVKWLHILCSTVTTEHLALLFVKWLHIMCSTVNSHYTGCLVSESRKGTRHKVAHTVPKNCERNWDGQAWLTGPYNTRKQETEHARTTRFWTVHVLNSHTYLFCTYVRPVHSGVNSVTSGTNSQTWTARPLPYSVKDAIPVCIWHQARPSSQTYRS
jgi:hypothetical protein